MFELGFDAPPRDERLLEALLAAIDGLATAGWQVDAATGSPVTGRHGAREMLIRAHRREAKYIAGQWQ